MRVAVLSRTFSTKAGGAERYSVAIVAELVSRHDIHVFSQQTDRPVPGVTYHHIACISQKPRWLNQLLFACLTWWKTRTGFDVVHSHENTWHGQIQTIHVRTVRNNLFHARRGAGKVLRWVKVLLSFRLMTYLVLEGLRFRNLSQRHIVAASDFLKNECIKAYPGRRRVRWSSVAPGTVIPSAMTPAEGRRQLGLPAGVPLILFVANDYARKGLDTLLAALSLLADAAHLAVVGDEGQKERFQHAVRARGLNERVHFLGSLSNLSPAYFAADVLAHPTREDSYGMVVLEAMAHRLPVIVSNGAYCGISLDLTDHVNAYLLKDPEDAATLANLLREVLFSDADDLRHFKEKSFDFASQHSWQSAALQYEELYKQVALTGRP